MFKRDGALEDFTGATHVRLLARKRGDDVALAAIEGVIASPSTDGEVDFDHVTIAVEDGQYLCDVEKVNAAGEVESVEDTFLIIVRERAAEISY